MRANVTENNYIYGASVSTYNPYAEMMMVKSAFQQLHGKSFFHYVFSVEENDEISLNDLYEIGVQIAEIIARFHGKFQVVMAVHFNVPEHYHLHIIANNIDYHTGERLKLEKHKLFELKNSINACLKNFEMSGIRLFSFSETNGRWQ